MQTLHPKVRNAAAAATTIGTAASVVVVYAVNEIRDLPDSVDAAVAALTVALVGFVAGYLSPRLPDEAQPFQATVTPVAGGDVVEPH